jgi:hypothetical protein
LIRRRDLLLLAGACLLLALEIWVSTGTLAPGAATLENPYVDGPCRYLMNIDHFHFKATFLMLDGAPRDQWEFSVVLRRLLYPLLAYPFMKVFGFGGGGLVTNVLFSGAAIAIFWVFLQRRNGGRVPVALLALLATYPGWIYWGGLPYSYAAIVPASLLCMVLLWRVEALAGWRPALLAGLGLGVLFTAYDLLPFFGVAALLLLLWRRRWPELLVLAVAQLIPPLLVNLLLAKVYAIPFRNNNTEAYYHIVRSYLPPYDWAGWGHQLALLPRVFVDTCLFSNFLFVPLLFLLGLVIAGMARRQLPRGAEGSTAPRLLQPAEIAVLATALLLFLFNNAAPPYPGWQLRGIWIARLYQPVLPAMLAVLGTLYARSASLPEQARRLATTALLLTVAVDAWVIFGPVLGAAGLSAQIHYRFYRHAQRVVYAENLRKFGARPVGFCGDPGPGPGQ